MLARTASRRAASRVVAACAGAVAVAVLLAGCMPGMAGRPASLTFADGSALSEADAGAISFYTDLDRVSGWAVEPGGDAEYIEYRQRGTGCLVSLDRFDVADEDYVIDGDDARSSAALVDATSDLHENRALRARSVVALNDTAASGAGRTMDVLRIVFAPVDSGVTRHDAALVRVFAGAGVGLVAQASCGTDRALRNAMTVLRRHVAFVVER
ncbi:hypothetical protein [Leifsonia sp. PS1209]|uniref:hypothetical protein n=1 Tax=Leifsonia sp. PS1209 TaxID=2724914 RepID=UPI001442A851|nr:hypothetical protein [Leifsonia sp. PS1209]QIZ97154.1 hypothetical protein HF024_00415 [Leifsonia sp. PS1209]